MPMICMTFWAVAFSVGRVTIGLFCGRQAWCSDHCIALSLLAGPWRIFIIQDSKVYHKSILSNLLGWVCSSSFVFLFDDCGSQGTAMFQFLLATWPVRRQLLETSSIGVLSLFTFMCSMKCCATMSRWSYCHSFVMRTLSCIISWLSRGFQKMVQPLWHLRQMWTTDTDRLLEGSWKHLNFLQVGKTVTVTRS